MVDRALDAVDRLPGPAEAYFLAAGFAIALFGNLTLWISGSSPPGQFNPEVVVASVLAGMFLALAAFMRRTAVAAFEDFRPALADEDSAEAERRRLISIPDRAFLVWATAVAAMTNALYLVYVKPTAAPRPPIVESVVAAAWLVFAIVLGLVVAQAITQLRSVRHLGVVARKIDVLNSGPVDALSGVTAVGAELIAASTERLKGILDALHRAADAHDYTSADALNKMLASAIAERDLLTRLPTWPWTTTTIRGFASALLLPVVIFVITRAIDRVF
ncbi:MAG: hypothetical protein QFC55_08810 [Chloroflexota bacterium]|nr:hypothetical protein [Chloroflexota bacterium]